MMPPRKKPNNFAQIVARRTTQKINYFFHKLGKGATTKPFGTFTAVFQEVPEGFIGFVEELPGANTQGATLSEARKNLVEAIELVIEANRELIEEFLAGQNFIREPISVL